ncbi:MAG: hypothetical protein C4334_13975 [Pyrinomonas sp.]
MYHSAKAESPRATFEVFEAVRFDVRRRSAAPFFSYTNARAQSAADSTSLDQQGVGLPFAASGADALRRAIYARLTRWSSASFHPRRPSLKLAEAVRPCRHDVPLVIARRLIGCRNACVVAWSLALCAIV